MVLEYTLYLVKFIYTIFPILESDRILILINIWTLLVAADDKSITALDTRPLSLNYYDNDDLSTANGKWLAM